MGLIVRIDVDRPYGKQGVLRHIASRISSDYYLPRLPAFRYLDELKTILDILDANGKQAHVFFRKCTYPTLAISKAMSAGGHRFGLHLENSRTEETFQEEHHALEKLLGRRVVEFSKHGSGRLHLGRFHYAPYEPERYLPWAKNAGMKYFFGNHENPEVLPVQDGPLTYFPSAFWLEPYWRDTRKYPIQWLLSEASQRDVVMLLHPDNVTSSPEIMREFIVAVEKLDTAHLQEL